MPTKPTPEQLAAANDSVLAVAKNIVARAGLPKPLTTVLSADSKKLAAALVVIGSTNMSMIVTSGARGGVVGPTVPANPVNTLSPTTPVILPAITGAETIQFQCLQSVTHHDGAQAATGIARYEVRRNSDDGTIASITTDANGTAIPLNIMPAFTLTKVGTITPNPTSSVDPTAGTYAISAGGSASDEVNASRGMLTVPWVAGQAVSADIDTFTSLGSAVFPGNFGGAGVGIFETTAANPKLYVAYQAVDAGSKVPYAKWTQVAAGALSQSSPAEGGNGSFGQVHVIPPTTGNTWSTYTQPDGGALAQLNSVDLTTMPTTGFAGVFVNALSSSIATAVFRQIAVRSAVPIKYVLNGTATDQMVQFRAIGVNGVASPWSLPSIASPGETPSDPTIIFNWGFYCTIDNQGYRLNPDREAVINLMIDTIQNRAEWHGVHLRVRLKDALENFDMIHRLLDRLQACPSGPKQLILNIQDRTFGGSNPLDYWPSPLNSTTHVSLNPGFYLNSVLKVWNSSTVTIFLEKLQLLADEFADHPRFEMIAIEGETAIPDSNPPVHNVNYSTYHPQQQRMLAALRVMWPTKGVRFYGNFYEASKTEAILQTCEDQAAAPGGPDPQLPIKSDGNVDEAAANFRPVDIAACVRGGVNQGNYHDYPLLGKDRRAICAIVFEVQGLGFNNIDGYNTSAINMIKYAKVNQRAHYIIMSTNDGFPAGQNWTADTLPYVASIGGIPGSTTTPTSYLH